jgi:hypothetical protein
VLIGPFIGLFAVGLAGKAAEGHEAAFFLGGWIMSMLAGAALYIEREV